MISALRLLGSSLGKKYLMALTGLVLVLFVLGHMLGNLQVFLDPYYINAYAHKLQSLGPALWVIRLFLLGCVAVHVLTAILLVKENRAARPKNYEREATIQASYASRTMIWSGLIILSFIIFHILHYTAKSVYDYSSLGYDLEAKTALVMAAGTEFGEHIVPNVHAMMISGFSHWYVSLFYIVAMGLLCTHLSHGVSSMFQTVGMRNEAWRDRMDKAAVAYGWIIFVGFAIIPLAVVFGYGR